jgi:hypothetical protein
MLLRSSPDGAGGAGATGAPAPVGGPTGFARAAIGFASAWGLASPVGTRVCGSSVGIGTALAGTAGVALAGGGRSFRPEGSVIDAAGGGDGDGDA